jgi:hypothetical protein
VAKERLENIPGLFLGLSVPLKSHWFLFVPLSEPEPLRFSFPNARETKLLRITGCSAVW